MPAAYRYKKIVDVGGCQAAVLRLLLSRNPDIQGVNFDRLDVIASLSPVDESLAGRLTYASGDFFQPLPPETHGADAIVMKHIMWVPTTAFFTWHSLSPCSLVAS